MKSPRPSSISTASCTPPTASWSPAAIWALKCRPEKVPAIQKHIIRRAAEFRKPVITATQMLESMIENPRPTRAEVSDVANAVYDGTDAVMLSGESAVGKYPVETVAMMARIVADAERHIKEQNYSEPRERRSHLSIAETICEATAHAADDLDLRGIALFTESGVTARQLSKYHPSAPIFALSPVEVTINRLNLLWGTTPIRCPKVNTTEALVECAESLLEQGGFVRAREVIAIVAGTRTKSGSTNFLRLHVMGEHNQEGVRFFAPQGRRARRRLRQRCQAQAPQSQVHREAPSNASASSTAIFGARKSPVGRTAGAAVGRNAGAAVGCDRRGRSWPHRRCLLRRQLPQHVLQYSAMLEVLDLLRRIDAHLGDRTPSPSVSGSRLHLQCAPRSKLWRQQLGQSPAKSYTSSPVSPSDSTFWPVLKLQRQNAHAHQVRTVNALEALRNHRPHAQQLWSLGRPVARRTRTVFLARQNHQRHVRARHTLR